MGLTEQSVFPEINPAKVEAQQGMNITFVTTAKTDEEARGCWRCSACRSGAVRRLALNVVREGDFWSIEMSTKALENQSETETEVSGQADTRAARFAAGPKRCTGSSSMQDLFQNLANEGKIPGVKRPVGKTVPEKPANAESIQDRGL